MSESEQLARAALAAAGIRASDVEIAELSEAYPELRRTADSLYRVLEMEEESPALVFEPSAGKSARSGAA